MSKQLLARRGRVLALVVALALGTAACGSGDDSASPTLAVQDDTSGDQVAEPEGGPADEPAAEPDGATASSDGDAAPEGEQAEPDTPIANLFPDIDVLDIADGSAVNLAAELGGGDKATLLWFFAPH